MSSPWTDRVIVSLLHRRAHSLRQAVEQRLRNWTRPEKCGSVVNAALDLTRRKSELVMENALFASSSWTLIVFLASKLRRWKEALIIVQPDTVLRWNRDLLTCTVLDG